MIFPDKNSEFYKQAVGQVDIDCQDVGAHIMAAIDAVTNEHSSSLVLAVQWLTLEKIQHHYAAQNVPIEAFEHSFDFIRDEFHKIALGIERNIETPHLFFSAICPEPF